jgi:hypothetical protein
VGIVPAEVVQQGTLAALADRFAIVVSDAETLAGAMHPGTYRKVMSA